MPNPSLARVLVSCLFALALALEARAEKQLLWGDTHLHTNNSFDAYLNQNLTADPDTAYRYAKGLPVVHPGSRARIQIETPLDFLVIADHAEYLGVIRKTVEQGIPREGLGLGERLVAWYIERSFRDAIEKKTGGAAFRSLLPATVDVETAAANPPAPAIPNHLRMTRSVWDEATRTADEHNEPGAFTALIGWEWSSVPAGANLHRVVFTNADGEKARRFLPFSSSESMYPEDLWAWLDETSEATGVGFTSIPHNSNISKGYMFPEGERLRGTAIDAEWAKARERWERVVEVTQIKGDSETHPRLSPDDPFADFETYGFYIEQKPAPYEPKAADYARAALRTGLLIEERIGFNPYRFGMIGATDAHTGVASAEEPNFWGKFPSNGLPETKPAEAGLGRGRTGFSFAAQGLAAVWAEENTRDAILAAFERREVYATTGPRIAVRVFAGEGFSPGDAQARDIDAVGKAKGVPMGGELAGLGRAPALLIHAAKDPMSAHLDRVQVVKGWVADGKSFERVHDVVWSGDRRRDAKGRVPAVPDTVDRETGRYTNEHGAAQLATVWRDPDFDPKERAFYYVRVLEVPTPRYSLLDALALGIPAEETGHPASIQERAYTSPIHYRP